MLIFTLVALLFVTLLSHDSEKARASSDSDSFVYLPLVTNPLPAIIPDTTGVLSEETTEHLMSVSEDLSVFTFNQMTPELASVGVGDVIVSGPSAAAPYGFLRSVAGATSAGGQVIVTTLPATLEDAVEQGMFTLDRTFTPDDVVATTLREGVSVHAPLRPSDEGWTVEINSPDLGCLDVSGSVSISNLDVNAGRQIHFFSLTEFRAEVSVDVSDDLSVEVVCEEELVDSELPLAQFLMGATVVPLGPIPVVFVTTMDIVIGA